jgi:hypothetical protein
LFLQFRHRELATLTLGKFWVDTRIYLLVKFRHHLRVKFATLTLLCMVSEFSEFIVFGTLSDNPVSKSTKGREKKI